MFLLSSRRGNVTFYSYVPSFIFELPDTLHALELSLIHV